MYVIQLENELVDVLYKVKKFLFGELKYEFGWFIHNYLICYVLFELK